MQDESLKGGRSTAVVFKRGDNVHRSPHVNSEFVRMLLLYLEGVGFDAAPRSYGSDEGHRDVFSFIAGDVPSELEFHNEQQLHAAARLIRRFHDATEGLLSPVARSSGMEVVCHNDLSPCNFVFREGKPVAIIDFDAASLGRRAYDLGYAAWLWLQLGDEDISPRDQIERLKGFTAAYGNNLSVREIVGAVRVRQAVLRQEGRKVGNEDMSEWSDAALRWTTQELLPLIP